MTKPKMNPCRQMPFAFLLLAGVGGAGCHSSLLTSAWLNAEANAPGKPAWNSLPAMKPEKLPGTLCLSNDSSAFYLRWTTTDPGMNQRLIETGMTLWLIDPDDKTRRLGLHYPLGNDARDRQQAHYLPSAELAPEVIEGLLRFQTDEFEVLLGSGQDLLTERGGEAGQLGAWALLSERPDGTVEYTLRLAFGAAVPWLTPGARVRLLIDAPAVTRAAEDRPRRHGGGGHAGRGHGPETSPGRERERRAFLSPLRALHWQTTVQLSAGPVLGPADKNGSVGSGAP